MTETDRLADARARERITRSLSGLAADFDEVCLRPLWDTASQQKRNDRARAILDFDNQAAKARAWYSSDNGLSGAALEAAYLPTHKRLCDLLMVICGRDEYQELEHTLSG